MKSGDKAVGKVQSRAELEFEKSEYESTFSDFDELAIQ
jgi:hypothetical protein